MGLWHLARLGRVQWQNLESCPTLDAAVHVELRDILGGVINADNEFGPY